MSNTPYTDAKRKWINIAIYAIPFALCYAVVKYGIMPHFF